MCSAGWCRGSLGTSAFLLASFLAACAGSSRPPPALPAAFVAESATPAESTPAREPPPTSPDVPQPMLSAKDRWFVAQMFEEVAAEPRLLGDVARLLFDPRHVEVVRWRGSGACGSAADPACLLDAARAMRTSMLLVLAEREDGGGVRYAASRLDVESGAMVASAERAAPEDVLQRQAVIAALLAEVAGAERLLPSGVLTPEAARANFDTTKVLLAGCVTRLGPLPAPGSFDATFRVEADGAIRQILVDDVRLGELTQFNEDIVVCAKQVLVSQRWPAPVGAGVAVVRLSLQVLP